MRKLCRKTTRFYFAVPVSNMNTVHVTGYGYAPVGDLFLTDAPQYD